MSDPQVEETNSRRDFLKKTIDTAANLAAAGLAAHGGYTLGSMKKEGENAPDQKDKKEPVQAGKDQNSRENRDQELFATAELAAAGILAAREPVGAFMRDCGTMGADAEEALADSRRRNLDNVLERARKRKDSDPVQQR